MRADACVCKYVHALFSVVPCGVERRLNAIDTMCHSYFCCLKITKLYLIINTSTLQDIRITLMRFQYNDTVISAHKTSHEGLFKLPVNSLFYTYIESKKILHRHQICSYAYLCNCIIAMKWFPGIHQCISTLISAFNYTLYSYNLKLYAHIDVHPYTYMNIIKKMYRKKHSMVIVTWDLHHILFVTTYDVWHKII